MWVRCAVVAIMVFEAVGGTSVAIGTGRRQINVSWREWLLTELSVVYSAVASCQEMKNSAELVSAMMPSKR